MIKFRDIPIRQKLMVILIVTTSAALVLSGLGVVLADSILFRGYLERDLTTFARIIADNSTAALTFEDPQAATEMLGALRARTHLVAACLYRANGSTLAWYVRAGSNASCPPAPTQPGIQSIPGQLIASHPILLQNRRIGGLRIVYDLGEIQERMRIYGLTVLAVLLAASLLSLLLSSKLRNMFAAPILELAATTTRVSASRDYGLRASRLSNDEVGHLVGAFNEMLDGIQSRDTELRKSLGARDEALNRLARLNRDLKRSNGELARSNEDLERFAFIASHDLQEPLRMVALYSQLLVKKYGDAGGQSEMYIECIVSGTRRMRELLEDLLVYVEIAARADQQLDTVDLNVVVAKAIANLRVAVEESGAEIACDRLPVVQAYDGNLISLFQNLIGNSIKYRGDSPPRIHITVEQVDGMHRFAVSDNGIGIAPEYHSRIFQAFKRLHGKNIPGTGIGLAICQRVVERYGGRIWVESELGQGATFLFTFPQSTREPSMPVAGGV